MADSFSRISAMVMRYFLLMQRSWPRWIDLIYWPTLQMVMWGFITKFLSTNSSWVAQSAGALIFAALLWDVLFRGQIGVSVLFFEELYARNLGQLFASPLRAAELATALLCMSLLRTLVSFSASSLLAWAFYGYDVLHLGWPLVWLFFSLIIMGWGIGLAVAGMVLRCGLGAEGLAWAAVFILAPLSGVYYPIATLPRWLQHIAYALPSTHVFEGMRHILIQGEFQAHYLQTALLLNVGFIAAGFAIFLYFFHAARQHGLLLKVGE